MQNQFLVLTTLENTTVIIGISNIAIIEANPDNPNNTRITLNFSRGKDQEPQTVLVTQRLGLIKSMLEG